MDFLLFNHRDRNFRFKLVEHINFILFFMYDYYISFHTSFTRFFVEFDPFSMNSSG